MRPLLIAGFLVTSLPALAQTPVTSAPPPASPVPSTIPAPALARPSGVASRASQVTPAQPKSANSDVGRAKALPLVSEGGGATSATQ